MSLPWFPFNIKDFLANTKRLNTEAKGAYLCLMLDYYEQEGPAPDDDEVLAAICELPIEAWKRHRKVIAPLFEVKDGVWRHERIEREIESGNTKLAQSKARAQLGAAAMLRNKSRKLASSSQQVQPKQQSAPVSASSELQAQLKQSPETAPLHLPIESLSVSVLTGEKDNSGDNSGPPSITQPRNPDLEPVHWTEDQPQPEGLGSAIDHQFWPCENHIAMCKFDGADDDTINTEVQKFVLYHLDKGSWSADWDASFGLWWQRWKEHQARQKPKAPPRIEVNAKGHQPTDAEWRSWLLRWKSDSFWPRAAGPDPSTGRCKAPPELFEQLGIDPKTGLSVAKPKETTT